MTVYERDEAGGGLVRFGVPHFKIEKWVVERRLEQLQRRGRASSSTASTSASTSTPTELRAAHDAVVIATGSRVPRDLPVPGRELDGVHYAMEYLYDRARCLEGNAAGGRRSPRPASTCSSSAAATPARTASATRTARARRR